MRRELDVDKFQELFGCNTAKGQNPLRRWVQQQAPAYQQQVAIPRKGRTLCGLMPGRMDACVLKSLQYRERAEPFAASSAHFYYADRTKRLQYRERAEPFAAQKRSNDFYIESLEVAIPRKGRTLCGDGGRSYKDITFEVAIPRKGRTLCGVETPLALRKSSLGCNTAKGQNPLRQEDHDN